MSNLVLIADDEENIRNMVSGYLQKMGFRTVTAANGIEALRLLETSPPDLVLLDVMMPEMDGFTLAKVLMNRTTVPLLFMTARAEEADKVLGLELGADDYITKPFSLRELTARIQAVLRRVRRSSPPAVTPESQGQVLRWKDLELDLDGARVRQNGQTITLTAVQFHILVLLLKHPGRVFSRLQVLEEVRDSSFEGYERTIDVHVKNLRKQLGDDVHAPRYIETVRGLGYRLVES